MTGAWKAFRYRLEVLGIRFLAALIPKLPRPLASHLARGSRALAAGPDRHRWQTSLRSLKAALCTRYPPREREAIALT